MAGWFQVHGKGEWLAGGWAGNASWKIQRWLGQSGRGLHALQDASARPNERWRRMRGRFSHGDRLPIGATWQGGRMVLNDRMGVGDRTKSAVVGNIRRWLDWPEAELK